MKSQAGVRGTEPAVPGRSSFWLVLRMRRDENELIFETRSGRDEQELLWVVLRTPGHKLNFKTYQSSCFSVSSKFRILNIHTQNV